MHIATSKGYVKVYLTYCMGIHIKDTAQAMHRHKWTMLEMNMFEAT